MHWFTTLMNHLPVIIRWPVEFYIVYILIRGVAAKDITMFLEDHGLIKDGRNGYVYQALTFLYTHITRLFKRLPSYQQHRAVWRHYKFNHRSESAYFCDQDECVVFTKMVTPAP